MLPNGDEIYVLYLVIGDGHDYAIELATEATVREMPYMWPSESYWMLPQQTPGA